MGTGGVARSVPRLLRSLAPRIDLVRARWLAFAALAVVGNWTLLAWDPDEGIRRFTVGVESAFFEPTGQSPRLILALTAFLVWSRARRLGASTAEGGNVWLATVLLCPAAAISVWAHYIAAPDLLIPALQLLLLGAGALLGGTGGFRAMRLPALFLFLAVPIPPPLMNQLIFPLQLATAEAVQWVLGVLGYESRLLGDHVQAPWGTFQVIETCSGVRLAQTLSMASIVYGELFHRGWARTALLLALAPVLGLAVNVVRVLWIVLDPWAVEYTEHTFQGIVMVVVGVLAIAAIDEVAERVAGPSARSRSREVSLARAELPRRAGVLAGLLLALALLPAVLPAWNEPEAAVPPSIRAVPRQVEDWTSNGVKVDTRFLGSVTFSDRTYREFRREGETVRVFIGEDDRLERRRSLVSPKTRYPGSASQLHERSAVDIAGTEADLLLFETPTGERLVLHWSQGIDPLPSEVLRSALGLDRGPFRRELPARVWRLDTAVDGTLQEARERLLGLAAALHRTWSGIEERGAADLHGRSR